MSLMPLQALPVQRTPQGMQPSRAADHSAWVPTDESGAGQSMMIFPPGVPLEDTGAGQSMMIFPPGVPLEDTGAELSFAPMTIIPFEDAGAEQSWQLWNIPFEA